MRVAVLQRLRGMVSRRRKESSELSSVEFRLRYQRFRELLALNDTTLQLFADIEDRLSSPAPFALDTVLQRVRRVSMDVFVMVKDLNQIAENRFSDLYDSLTAIYGQLDAELQRLRGVTQGPLVVPIGELRTTDTAAAGAKMAVLGEVAAACHEAVPSGFAITTAAFDLFMSENGLWERCEELEGLLEAAGPASLAAGCAEVRSAILGSALPEPLAEALAVAWNDAFGRSDVAVAVRSSAAGEDAVSSSHAGIYYSELHVRRERLHDVYRTVVASAFSPVAVSYRFARGLTAGESAMAVGCLEMLEPSTSGIMFSRHPDRPEDDLVMISAVRGVAAGVAAGTEGAAVWVGPPDGPFAGPGEPLGRAELDRLAATARRLEHHFGSPQDVEWALEREGRLFILQSRPVVAAAARAPSPASPGVLDDLPVLVEGGATACAGVGSGPVVVVSGEVDLQQFPEGGVLVAHHSSPAFMQAMARCAAIVTEVGSPTGHMAILAREFGVPSVVGMERAGEALTPGRLVTVDAKMRRVLDGPPPNGVVGRRETPARLESPATQALARVAEFVTPLHLTDPAARGFSPQGCRTLHDITRFVHEKAFEVMFHFGDAAAADRHHSYRLDAPLPIEIRVFDVGGGLASESYPSGLVAGEDVTSVPMRAFLDGMLDERLPWGQPRPVSMTGFLSVLGESLIGPPPRAQQLGRLSYAIASDRYLNFSTKAGYHFSTVDSYCGRSTNKNYIHFRFSGGAADARRRRRRIQFLVRVLEGIGFAVRTRGDVLHARFDKYPQDEIRGRLTELGRLTMCSRQLDMLMDSDASPEFFARAFLDGRLDQF